MNKLLKLILVIIVFFGCKEAILNHPMEGAGGILIGVHQKSSGIYIPADPSIIVTGTGSTITEGKARIVSLKLSAGIPKNLVVTIASSNSAISIDGSASLTLTLTPSDATIDHEFIIAAEVDDNLVSEVSTVTISAPGLKEVSFNVTATDKDTQNFSLGGATFATEGSSPGFIAVVLTKIPNSNVTVNISSGNTSAITLNPSTLTFTPANYGTPQLVGARAIEDFNLLNDVVTITFSSADVPTATYEMTAKDNDTASVSAIVPANGATFVNPDPAQIKIIFSQPMDISSSPVLTTTNNSTTIPVSIRTKTWSKTTTDNDTLTMDLSWILFPEVTQIDWTVSQTGLLTAEGFAINSDINGSFTTSTRIASFALSDSGQTLCYNNTTTIPCGDASFPRQDGDFPRARSFTGPLEHSTYTGNYVTIDNVTGLVWKTCTEGMIGSTCTTNSGNVNLTWYNSIDGCSVNNTANGGAGYYGRTNWRFATLKELTSLIDYSLLATNPYFPAFPGSWWLTATTAASIPANMWAITAGGGGIAWAFTNGKTNVPGRRCVSENTAPVSNSYTNLGGGMIRDNAANLIWQRCAAGQVNDSICSGSRILMNWQNALNYCNSLSLGGRSWRLPSIRELTALVDFSRFESAIDPLFPNNRTVSSEGYSSSTTSAANNANVWFMLFEYGAPTTIAKTNSSYTFVRCVTDGP